MNALSAEQASTRLNQLRALRQRVDDEIAVLTAALAIPRKTSRRSKFEVPPCGTETAYQRHRYHGEDCGECRAAHAAHERVAAARRRLAKVGAL